MIFFKMCAAGNDFIVVDNREGKLKDSKRFAREVSPRHSAVGADGLLLVEKAKGTNFRMRIFNADGSEPEMCGNGVRCLALFAHKILQMPKELRIETLAGEVKAWVEEDRVRVNLMEPHQIQSEQILEVDGKKICYYFINTGVPHLVSFQEDLEKFPVKELGRLIRYHQQFQPQGTNVNFVKITGKNQIRLRTYERGVEDETLACGTGATASAIASVLSGKCQVPVEVQTQSGEMLTIYFKHQAAKVTNVYLEGKARFVFKGELL